MGQASELPNFNQCAIYETFEISSGMDISLEQALVIVLMSISLQGLIIQSVGPLLRLGTVVAVDRTSHFLIFLNLKNHIHFLFVYVLGVCVLCVCSMCTMACLWRPEDTF